MPAKRTKKQSALMIGVITLGIAFTVFFGIRLLHAYKKFDGHHPPLPGKPGKVETDVELIRDWMTISFIARTYRVPEKDIFDILQISPMGNHEKNLKDLNQEYYPNSEGFVLDTVKAAVKKLQPPPTPVTAPQTVSKPTAPAP